MPTSILDIEINDEAFKSYIERWEKYQEQVKDQPKLFGEQSEMVSAIGLGFAAMTAELIAQNNEINKQLKAEKELDKQRREAARAKRQEEKEEAEAEKQAAARRRQLIDNVRSLGREIASAVKWGAVGGGAALAGGALSFWGLDQFVAGVGQERRLASGFGVSTGERQALGVNFQRYFDTNSALENVSEAQADPSKRWIFSGFGVNPAGKDPAQLTTEMALRARQLFIQGGGNEAWAQAHGLTDIFSMDELRRLQHTPEAELRAGVKNYGQDVGKFALSDDVNYKWQNFIVKLDEAGVHLKDVLVDKLSAMEPDLERLIGKFTQLAVTVLDRIDFKVLGDGLDQFTRYIGSKQFQTDFKHVVDDISYAANKLVGAMRLLGLLPDTPAPAGAPPKGKVGVDPTAPGGYWTHDLFGNPHWHRPDKPMFGGGGVDPSAALGAVAGGALGAVAGVAKGVKVAGMLAKDLGVGGTGADALVGNLLYENPGLVAMNEKHPLVPGSKGGFGWAQWTGEGPKGRRRAFEQWAAANKLDVNSDAANYGFLVYELKTKYKALLERLKHESLSAGVEDVMRTFEAPRSMASLARRQAIAVTVKTHAGASVAVSANSASQGG